MDSQGSDGLSDSDSCSSYGDKNWRKRFKQDREPHPVSSSESDEGQQVKGCISPSRPGPSESDPGQQVKKKKETKKRLPDVPRPGQVHDVIAPSSASQKTIIRLPITESAEVEKKPIPFKK